ncbi:HEAT repeat domain-containing protein [Acrocarpospora corrugata]|nr:hypothetical protein [Acrocarpospora corrugata]
MLDSIRRLAHESAIGGRRAADGLADALVVVVSDDRLAGRALELVHQAGSKIWIDLDLALRSHFSGYSKERIATAKLVAKMRNPLAIAMAACSPDGRQRERAAGHPAMWSDTRLLPMLTIRTTDWAAPVRAKALYVLARVLFADDAPALRTWALHPGDAAALRAVLPVVVRLGERSRGSGSLDVVRRALSRADDATLTDVRQSADWRGRRFAYEVSLDGGRMSEAEMMRAVFDGSDIVVRTRCAKALVGRAITADRPDILERLLDGTAAQIRVAALTALVQLGRTDHGLRFLADNASMVRLTAQWAVSRAGGDPAAHYRRHLATPSGQNPRGYLAGLGDCGTSADAHLVIPHLHDARPRVRAEAVRTLRRLNAETDVIALLEDAAPAVVRNVVKTIRSSAAGVPADRLWALLTPDHPRHVRHAARRLLSGQDPWTRIKADLILSTDPDEALATTARADLAAWCSRDLPRAYPSWPAEARHELADLVTRSEHAVSPNDTRLLRWLLNASG